MIELAMLLVFLVLVGLGLSVLFAILGLVFKVILLPIQLGFWLVKGILGLALTLLGLIILLPLAGVALPFIILVLGLPLAIVGLIVWLVKHTAVEKA